jgi:tRNA (guanine-N7-)-methyltransferase
MRMRKKKWAEPELAVCPYYISAPEEHRGAWNEIFPRKAPLWMELGCGKGSFLAALALREREINFVGVDLISDMLGVARRKIQAAFDAQGLPVDNLILTAFDISRIRLYWDEADPVDRIFINFCNPWFRPKQFKKRLTHPRQLVQYRTFLRDGGEIWFKTDDEMLFEHSIPYFEECGFRVKFITRDLHASGFSGNIPTEHEEMYSAEGIPIKFVIVEKLPGDFSHKAAELPLDKQGEIQYNSTL